MASDGSWHKPETKALPRLEDFSTADQFDAVVGRYVLLYQPDPAVTLRQMARFVKPGGTVAFHEADFSMREFACPPCELADQVAALIPEVFRRIRLPPDFGRYLGRTYLDAGLPFPALVAENPGGREAAHTCIVQPRRKTCDGARKPRGGADDTLVP
jgi:SAM-dependent methyltransferase